MTVLDVMLLGGIAGIAAVLMAGMAWETRRFDRRWGKEPPRADR